MTRVEEKRECRDKFFKVFSHELLDQIERGSEMMEIFGKRPQERWTYGFVVQALSATLKKDGMPNPIILTEVPVARGKNGRIDFVFQYQGNLFLMEVKASVFALPISEKQLAGGLKNTWVAVQKQLQDIPLNKYKENKNHKLSKLADTGRIIRFALLIVAGGNTGTEKALNDKSYKQVYWDDEMLKMRKALNAEFGCSRINNRKAFTHFGGEKYRREFGWLLFGGKV